jgi:Spy/CpxP family protein refolding chaperone
MKKIVFVLSLILMTTATFAQDKPKDMKVLRDSIFTVMKLTKVNRQKMHDLIAENGKGQKAIKDDPALFYDQRKEKLEAWKKDITAKEKAILTPAQFQIWRDFGKSVNKARE